jgi:hypothetical protein
MRAPEGISNSFTTQTSTAGVVLLGGQYQLQAWSAGWNGAHASVDQLMADGSTWLASLVLAATANAIALTYLPAGTYRLTVGTATPSSALVLGLQRIPGE